MSLELKCPAELMGRGRAARSRKPDSGHADTISITVRACRTRRNVMKPGIQCALTQGIPGSMASGTRPIFMINIS